MLEFLEYLCRFLLGFLFGLVVRYYYKIRKEIKRTTHEWDNNIFLCKTKPCVQVPFDTWAKFEEHIFDNHTKV